MALVRAAGGAAGGSEDHHCGGADWKRGGGVRSAARLPPDCLLSVAFMTAYGSTIVAVGSMASSSKVSPLFSPTATHSTRAIAERSSSSESSDMVADRKSKEDGSTC